MLMGKKHARMGDRILVPLTRSYRLFRHLFSIIPVHHHFCHYREDTRETLRAVPGWGQVTDGHPGFEKKES